MAYAMSREQRAAPAVTSVLGHPQHQRPQDPRSLGGPFRAPFHRHTTTAHNPAETPGSEPGELGPIAKIQRGLVSSTLGKFRSFRRRRDVEDLPVGPLRAAFPVRVVVYGAVFGA